MYSFELLHSTSVTAVICGFVALSALVADFFLRFRTRKLPPGPKGDPIIGNYRFMPELHPWLYYTELKKKYGDIVYVRVLAQKILLLGSYEVTNQLLSKRGPNNSDRPKFALIDETLGVHPPMSPYGEKWREERRMYHSHLGKDIVRTQYRTEMEFQAHDWTLQCIEAGKNVSGDYFLALLKTFLHVIYGIKVKSNDDDILQVAVKATELGSNTIIPGKFWINLIPGLGKLRNLADKLSWNKAGEHMEVWMGLMTRLIVEPYEQAKREDKEGLGKQSFLVSMIHDETTKLTEPQVMFTGGSSFVAGSDTTGGTVQHFLYAILQRPDVQKRAQEEIDRVIGHDRLPTVDDLSDLPYIEAVYKEILRWRPVAPFSLPHSSLEEDVFNDYVIPAGTMIIQNTWAIAYDEKAYPEPEKFLPERFLTNDPPMDPRYYVFGVGRRLCPGMALGEGIVQAAILTMFATVDILPAVDANGKDIPVAGGTTGKLLDTPLPFEFRLKARSDAAVALLRGSVASAAA